LRDAAFHLEKGVGRKRRIHKGYTGY
jgi:hypothetical protein